MSTDSSENGDSTDAYDPADLRKIVPSTLDDGGTRALVCAIRNPDATTGQIAEKCGLGSSYTVENALRSAVQAADRDSIDYGQMHELRGGARDAETYDELTEKQRAVVDIYAEAPEWCEDHTYSDIAQAIQERDGVVVNETYVGQVRSKYGGILHRQRALAASEGEADVDLEAALSDMTVREVLNAAGYSLPSGNLDEMPVPGTDQEQATLADSREAEAEFQAATEVEDEGAGSAYTPLSDAWCKAHTDCYGADDAQRLPDSAGEDDVSGGAYWACVNGTTSYGVFVSLTNPPTPQDDVSGLLKESRLHGRSSEYERGDPMVVELYQENPQGLEFADWRITHPEAESESADEAEDEGVDAAEEQAATSGGGGAEAQRQAGEGEDIESHPDVGTGTDSGEMGPPALPPDLGDRLDSLEAAVDTLREDTVLASEMREFATEVEGRLATLEDAPADGAAEVEGQVADLQEVVDGLAEQVDSLTQTAGGLGRAQEALERMASQDATVEAYRYSEEDGTVTLHVEATVERTRQASLSEAAQEVSK